MIRCIICVPLFALCHISNGQHLQWAHQIASHSVDYDAADITVDAAGNIYSLGTFADTTDFDPGAGVVNLNDAGETDVFVAKYNATGDLLWARSLGGLNFDEGSSLALDINGNVIICGYFYETIDCDPGAGTYPLTSAGLVDAFICKLSTTGNFVWAKSFGGTGNDVPISMVAEPLTGNIYITGYFNGTVDFDPGTGAFNMVSAGSEDIFVSKLDALGNFIWSKRMGGIDSDRGYAIQSIDGGHVYISGSYNATADFDPGTSISNLTSAGLSDGYICKLDASGNYVWAKSFGGTGVDAANNLILDNDGNPVISGFFSNVADFDPNAGTHNLTSGGSYDVFTAEVSSTGNLVWVSQFEGPGDDMSYGIDVDNTGNIYTTGVFSSTIDFESGPGITSITAAGATDVFICKSDTSGTLMWATAYGDFLNDYGKALAIGNDNSIHAIGRFSYNVDFDPEPDSFVLNAGTSDDVYIMKLLQCDHSFATITAADCYAYTSPSGLHLWTSSGTYNDTIPNASGCDSIITVNLTIHTMDTTVTFNFPDITADATGATFQWVDCNAAFSVISGQTNQTFTPSVDGSYAAIISQNGCVDTSACVAVLGLGFSNEMNAEKIIVYPNPTNGKIYLNADFRNSNVRWIVRNTLGQQVAAGHFINNAENEIDIPGHAGIYFIELMPDSGDHYVVKAVKE